MISTVKHTFECSQVLIKLYFTGVDIEGTKGTFISSIFHLNHLKMPRVVYLRLVHRGHQSAVNNGDCIPLSSSPRDSVHHAVLGTWYTSLPLTNVNHVMLVRSQRQMQ